MIMLKVYRKDLKDDNNKLYPVYDLSFYDKLNLVGGNSGSGKSYFANVLEDALNNTQPWTYECFNVLNPDEKVKVIVVKSLNEIDTLLTNNKDCVIVIDEDTTINLRKMNGLALVKKSQNYFILMDRQLEIKMDINVKAIFKFSEYGYKRHKTYKLENYFNIREVDIKNADISRITHVITEDSTSGKLF